MKILLAGQGRYEWFAPAWVKGLQSLGHEVYFFDWGPFFPSGLLGKMEHKWMRGPALSRINFELRRLAHQIRPDVLLIHCGFPIQPETVIELTRLYWVTGFHHDDPFGSFGRKAYFRLFRRAIPFYSSHHVIREENLLDYKRLGVQRVRLFMRYYVPWIHYPRRGDGGETSAAGLQVVFAGHAEADGRIQYITGLLRAGLPLRLFGSPEWKSFLPQEVRRRLAPARPLAPDAYAATLSAAKICIAFHSGGNRDRYSYRVFEIPACRGFLLAERSDVMDSLYEEGTEAEYFGSSEELIEKTRFYLRHENARLQIAERGYQRCLRSGYDVVSRLKQWVSDVRGFRREP